jgi:hypothetical protein
MTPWLGANGSGVNGSHPDVTSRTIGYPLSLAEHEAS